MADVWTVVHCGTLLAVPGEDPVTHASIIIKQDRIASVRRGYVDPETLEGAEGVEIRVVDLREYFVMPGLIDVHVHLTSSGRSSPGQRYGEASRTLDALENARITLDAGFTTVRDLGSQGDAVFALRDAIAANTLRGPRIQAAGAVIGPTGGHGDPMVGGAALPDVAAMSHRSADSTADARRAVRTQVKRGADLIKVAATGGVLSRVDTGLDLQLLDDELEAVIATSRLLKRRIAAHAHGTDGINAALRAGANSIEHGSFLDEESIELMLENDVYLVPTMAASKMIAKNAAALDDESVVTKKAQRVGAAIQRAVTKAHAAGVKIAFGSDAGVGFRHGQNTQEFLELVGAGLKPMEAIRTATIHAADLMGQSHQLGSLEKGKSADVIALKQNPLVAIENLSDPIFVMQGGTVIKEVRK